MSAAAAAAEQGVEHQASDVLEALMATWLGEEKALPNGASELELKASIKLLQAQRAAAVGKAELARIDGELGARFEQLRARRGLQLLESGRIWECIGTKVHRDEGERGGRGGNEGRASHAGGDDSGEGEGEGAGEGEGEGWVWVRVRARVWVVQLALHLPPLLEVLALLAAQLLHLVRVRLRASVRGRGRGRGRGSDRVRVRVRGRGRGRGRVTTSMLWNQSSRAPE